MERTLRKTELEKQKIEAMFKDINVKIALIDFIDTMVFGK